MIATIHQPDFMPWLGFFTKISKADIFVILDHTENQPGNTSFWCRRVKMLINKQETWFSIPLLKPEGIISQPIKEMKINISDSKIFDKKIRSLRESYSKAPHFKDIFPLIEDYFSDTSEYMITRNMNFIKTVADRLGINCKYVYSSLLDCEKKSSDLMIEITGKVNADTYLCGDGAGHYLQPDEFEKANIKLTYNNFAHPVYKQFNTDNFVKGLSVIDALMNTGFNGTRKLIMQGAGGTA
jgi:hypothetical protein